MPVVPVYLTHYPNMDTELPFHIKINHLKRDFGSHRHDFLEFSYVIEGRGFEIINGVQHPMEPGTFTLVMPYQFHSIHSEPEHPLRLYNCNFGIHLYNSSEQLPGSVETFGERELLPYVQVPAGEQEKFQEILKELYEEYHDEQIWRHALIKVKLTEILVRFDRLRRSAQLMDTVNEVIKTEGRERGRSSGDIWKAIQFVHEHYREDLTLSGLAQRFGFSVPYLSELFKKTIGQNFVSFVHEVRIRQACGLLIATEMTVLDIALETGYGSYNTFTRIFKESKGVTPAIFRKQNKLQLTDQR
ncbi:AraC family transcriptional regulator [Paenibacillus periandrae]|uniref:AraC family transcriptional regulator n=1 Tax=Paenibacillus periandrae TaxID=1761741 RepID=UPI001F08C829|nr:AraC family transcriptional regulator [Paenibacillus periandrae]